MTESTKYLTRGLESSLSDTPIEDGKLRYTTDSGKLFLDLKLDGSDSFKRIRISDVILDYTESEIRSIFNPISHKIYISKDTGKAFCLVNGNMEEINKISLVSSTDNSDYYLWFSSTDGSSPMYNTGLKYNPSTNTIFVDNIEVSTIKVGNMKITETVNEDMDHIVDFTFVGI